MSVSTQATPASVATPLAGEVALITGATSGIGRATARHLADLGAHVLVSGRDRTRGEETVARIRAAGGKADFLEADLADRGSVADLAQRAVELGGGRVDVLVNNAGIFEFVGTADTSDELFDRTFDVNVRAPYFLVAALAPGMAARGHGAIVNLTSVAAELGMPVGAAYGASKSALVLLTKAWASEFGPSGVRVNAVSPGPVLTEGTEPMREAVQQIATTTIANRVADPAEIATAIVFLAGPGATYIQGAIVDVDGGRTAI
jgi:NAD(P)-dependent dehydrogenase (short-subunit alcohol dehydrogenase family)